MIEPLRKTHRNGFVVLALLIIAVLVLSIRLKPVYPLDVVPEQPAPAEVEARV